MAAVRTMSPNVKTRAPVLCVEPPLQKIKALWSIAEELKNGSHWLTWDRWGVQRWHSLKKTGKGKEGKEKEKTGGEEKEKDDTQQKCRELGKEDGAADFSKTERE